MVSFENKTPRKDFSSRFFNKMHLVPAQKFFIEKIPVKLYGDLFYFLALAFVIKPPVPVSWGLPNKLKIIYCFNMISDNSLRVLSMLNKI
jgi:hypothetical protein